MRVSVVAVIPQGMGPKDNLVDGLRVSLETLSVPALPAVRTPAVPAAPSGPAGSGGGSPKKSAPKGF
jgi:hypothetical protein